MTRWAAPICLLMALLIECEGWSASWGAAAGGRRGLFGGKTSGGHLGAPHPSGRRQQAEECDLCADNWLFILGAGGRTGTTTALSMFDSVPGIELTGEHWGFLNEEAWVLQRLMDAERSGVVGRGHRSAPDVTGFKCDIQERTRRVLFGARHDELLPAAHIIGFKEIRYTSIQALRFLSRVFPCARFIFTYRRKHNVEVRAEEFSKAKARRQWEDSRNLFRVVHDAFNQTIGMLAVEALTLKHYNRLLTAKLGVRGCEFAKIIHDNAGGGYSKDRAGRSLADEVLHGECDLSGVDFRQSPDELTRREGVWDDLVAQVEALQLEHHHNATLSGAEAEIRRER